MTHKILCVAGARPSFMKLGPILRVLRSRARFAPRLIHTGLHYEPRLSMVFFDDLHIPHVEAGLRSFDNEIWDGRTAARIEQTWADIFRASV